MNLQLKQLITVLGTGALLGVSVAKADDGALLRKSMSSSPGTVEDPVPEAEHAFIDMMQFYIPAKAANGDPKTIEYYDTDDALVTTRAYAKPLISVYIDGPVAGVEHTGFGGHGRREAYAAVSLDDGETWKRANLSESAELSSFEVSIPIPDPSSTSDDGLPAGDPEGPVIVEAEWDAKRRGGKLEVEGIAERRDRVEVINAVSGERLLRVRAKRNGDFKRKKRLREAPCYIQAGVDGVFGEPVMVDDAPEACVGEPGQPLITDYPGDVINVFQATADNKALVVWPSRYCGSGSPNYSLDTSDPERREAIASYLGIDLTTASSDDLYLVDMFGVGGSQGSVDYSDDRFEPNQAVGEVPYSCLWSARGTLEVTDDGSYDMVWRKAERLTSGARDVNRVETKCVAGAGCAVSWQEDPEGLRPGQGEGPGEGWSGAIANSQTDIWYSYIPWDGFGLVQNPADETDIMTYQEFVDAGHTAKPQTAIPMAMPMRISDNAKCNAANPQPYCHGTAAALPPKEEGDLDPIAYGLRDLCMDTVQIPTGQSGSLADVCITDAGLPLIGNIASTRPRLGLFGYDSDGDTQIDNAWVVIQAEESKGLGAFFFDADGNPCEEGAEGCGVADEGKNVWYYTFGMSLTDQSAGSADGLLAHLGGHGNMLNQPEVNWQTGLFYPPMNTVNMWDFGGYNFDIYNTEIARRGSLLAQTPAAAASSQNGLAALPAWKQGAMNQGGPADVMVRRIVIPAGFDPAGDNPYAFGNMACDNWLIGPGANPYYPGGLCGDPAINLSSVTPDSCVDSSAGGDVPCPTVDPVTGIGDTNPILQGTEVEPNTTKVLAWHQCPAEFTTVSGETVSCEAGDTNLGDQSWFNPLDVSKGHRGFLDGDFVMMLYAWSPNWRLNARGSDRYELYIRRSFDGGLTWTNLPENFLASNGLSYSGAGNVHCESFRSEETGAGGAIVEEHVCNSYAPGAAEQARNVTQHASMRVTTLDPRYARTAASITDLNGVADEDVRDPSRYFIVFETGDNTTVEEGEAEPEDLFYSRAEHFGDNYQVWAEESDLTLCYPSDTHADDTIPDEVVGSGFCNEFDKMDQGSPGLQASEASLEANPSGSFMYGVWTQAAHDDDGALIESDAMARRVWWIDDYIGSDAWEVGDQENR